MYYFFMRAVWLKLLENPNCLHGLKNASRYDRLKSPVGLLIILIVVSNTESTLLAYI
jgi:hypothetical protein